MLPWPKPASWPVVPADGSAEILAKEKASLFCCKRSVLFFFPAPFHIHVILDSIVSILCLYPVDGTGLCLKE